MPYEPPKNMPKPEDADFQRFLIGELRKIAQASGQVSAQVLALQPLSTEPAKPRKGYMVYADGDNLDLGSGEGLYTYNGEDWIYAN